MSAIQDHSRTQRKALRARLQAAGVCLKDVAAEIQSQRMRGGKVAAGSVTYWFAETFAYTPYLDEQIPKVAERLISERRTINEKGKNS